MDVCRFLDGLGIEYQRRDHPAVFTCEEAERLVPALSGEKTKNLFLCDRRGREHFLVIVGHRKTVELAALSEALGTGNLRFASPARLERHLGVTPGAVTVLAARNDRARTVEVVFDRPLWQAEAIQCHPLVNTATVVLSLDGVRRFLGATGHRIRVVDVPGAEPR